MKKSNFIDDIRVAQPCSEKWDDMIGNDEVRFCTHCAKDVNDLSAMTRSRAQKLVDRSNGRLCVRYITDAKTGVPVFANNVVQMVRRAPRIATGVMSAALSFAGVGYAQSDTSRTPVISKVVEKSGAEKPPEPKESETTTLKTGSISGLVTDPQGAVVPGVTVVLLNDQDKSLITIATNDNGSFTFSDVQPGIYSISTRSAGFKASLTTGISVESGDVRSANVALELSERIVTMGAVAYSRPEYTGKLAKAVSDDDIDEVRRLIAAGENVNGREENKTTPLFIAVGNGNREMVQLLLDFGAKVNAHNEDKRTPLMELDDDASRELVEILIRAGAKIDAVSEEGKTALMFAAEYSTSDVVQALIDAGAELDLKDEDGATALMKAAESEDLAKVQALVFAGADINLRDNDNDNAWDYTSTDEIEGFLVAHGITVDPEDLEEVPADTEPD